MSSDQIPSEFKSYRKLLDAKIKIIKNKKQILDLCVQLAKFQQTKEDDKKLIEDLSQDLYDAQQQLDDDEELIQTLAQDVWEKDNEIEELKKQLHK